VSTDAVLLDIEKSYEIMGQLQAPAVLSLDPPYLLDRMVEKGYREARRLWEINVCPCWK
jgi:hypothetical protein